MTQQDPINIVESCGNVFLDLGFPPEEAVILAMRADLMAKLRLLIDAKDGHKQRHQNA